MRQSEPRKNVDAAKQILNEYFHMSEVCLDDSFFKNFLRDFEPVIASEVDEISLQIMKTIKEKEPKENLKSVSDMQRLITLS